MIELAQAQDGRLILGVNEPLPADIQFVEYYADMRLFSLSYENGESALMPLEIPPQIAPLVRAAAQLIVLVVENGVLEPVGYNVPLIQVGL